MSNTVVSLGKIYDQEVGIAKDQFVRFLDYLAKEPKIDPNEIRRHNWATYLASLHNAGLLSSTLSSKSAIQTSPELRSAIDEFITPYLA